MPTTSALKFSTGLVIFLSVMHVTQINCQSGFADDSSGSSSSSGLVAGGCAKAQLCCHGKNHTCGVTVTSTNVTMATTTKCFCDSECLLNHDCCHDYRDYCQPVDCVVEKKWRKWTPCSARCGVGTRNRTRSVIRSALHGGRECAATLQVGFCEGTECSGGGLRYRTMTSDEMKMKETEVAWLLPMAFARWRTDVSYSRKQSTGGFELRRSEDGTDWETQGTNTEYSAIYRLTEVGRGCNLQPTDVTPSSVWVTRVTRGTTVCVECQPTAVKYSLGGRCQGDGTSKMETRWAAVTIPGCHGKWVMVGKAERNGVCAQTQRDSDEETSSNSLNFIFV